jgi:hypothetical protein
MDGPQDELAALNFDDLLVLIAEQAFDLASGLDDEDKKRLGRAWFEGKVDVFREQVCPHVDGLLKGSEAEMAAAIMDLIAGATGRVSPFSASWLIVKSGLSRLC